MLHAAEHLLAAGHPALDLTGGQQEHPGGRRTCRNPVTLGAVLARLGVAIVARSTTGTGLVVAFGAGLLAYLKLLEEPELEERFGAQYLRYKQATPFIIPMRPACRGYRDNEGEAGT